MMQLVAAKVGLEGLLADTLISLMEFCLAYGTFDETGSYNAGSGADDSHNAFKMKLVRPSTRQHDDMPKLPFANGCGTSPVSLYAGGILSVLQQTEVRRWFSLLCSLSYVLLTLCGLGGGTDLEAHNARMHRREKNPHESDR